MLELKLLEVLIASISGVSGILTIGQYLSNLIYQKSEIKEISRSINDQDYFLKDNSELRDDVTKLLSILNRAEPLVKRIVFYRQIHHGIQLLVFLIFLFLVNILFSDPEKVANSVNNYIKTDVYNIYLMMVFAVIIICISYIFYTKKAKSIDSLLSKAKQNMDS